MNSLGYIQLGGKSQNYEDINNLSVGNGAVGQPSINFQAEPNSGFYRVGSHDIGVAINGVKVTDFTASGVSTTQPSLHANGTAAAPSYSFTSDPDSGLYRPAEDQVGVAVNGAEVLQVQSSGVVVTGSAQVGAGSAAAPSLTFSGDNDSGLYSAGADQIGIAINGAEVAQWQAGGLTGPSGGAANPSYSFTADATSGVYLNAAGDLGAPRIEICFWGQWWCECSRWQSSGLEPGCYCWISLHTYNEWRPFGHSCSFYREGGHAL